MSLEKWWDSKTVEEREKVARNAEITYAYLYQLCHGETGKRASTDLAKVLESATNKEVKRHHWRPDVWEAA
jgi:DNA-binding transcriptional regulator YdaS (Cro superfamily)